VVNHQNLTKKSQGCLKLFFQACFIEKLSYPMALPWIVICRPNFKTQTQKCFDNVRQKQIWMKPVFLHDHSWHNLSIFWANFSWHWLTKWTVWTSKLASRYRLNWLWDCDRGQLFKLTFRSRIIAPAPSLLARVAQPKHSRALRAPTNKKLQFESERAPAQVL